MWIFYNDCRYFNILIMEENIFLKIGVCLIFIGLIILCGVIVYGAFTLGTICGWTVIGLICLAAGAFFGCAT